MAAPSLLGLLKFSPTGIWWLGYLFGLLGQMKSQEQDDSTLLANYSFAAEATEPLELLEDKGCSTSHFQKGHGKIHT